MPQAAEIKPVGRPKHRPSREGRHQTHKSIGVRARIEWVDWLEEAADFCRIDTSKLLDLGAALYARQQGFTKEPPRRI